MRLLSVFCFALLTVSFLSPAQAADKPKYTSFGKIVRKDARFDKLVPPTANMEQLAEGFDWSEGPVWVKDGGYLLFSDIPRNSVMKWKEGEGATLWMKP